MGSLALFLALGGALGVGIFGLLMSSWSEMQTASPEDAAREFEEALAEADHGIPYLEISEQGTVQLHRELEGETPVSLEALVVLAWEPEGGRLLRVDFPFWFVRVKMTDHLNLGTLVSALAGDWDHLDLSVTEEDLEARGPGLILDHARPDGARILLWTR